MYGIILFALLGSVIANECPKITPVDNFNLESYGNGIWYELARYPNRAETSGHCGYAEYKLNDGVIQVKNVDTHNNKLRSIEGTAKLSSDAGTTGKMDFLLPYGPKGSLTTNVLNVLATDYDNYAIVYYCRYIEARKSYIDFAWVLSRSKKLEGAAKTAVDNFLKETTLVNKSKLVWPDFSDEACKVNA